MQLDGTLDKFPLRELIEMVIYSSVTGVLKLRVGGGEGQIFFRDGRPYHAVAGDQSGVEAVGSMFEQRDAPFRFVADQVDEAVTLWIDPWDMMDHAQALATSWTYVRRRLPSVDHIPQLVGTPAENQIQINETVWPVLAAIDSQRSIREIAEHQNLVLLDACLAITTLIEQRLVRLQPPRVVVPAPAQPAARGSLFAPKPAAAEQPAAPAEPAAPAAQNGFLERLLAEARAKEQQRPDLTDEGSQERKQSYRYVDDRR